MRKTAMIGVGVTAAVLAIGGVAAAATGSSTPVSTPKQVAVTSTAISQAEAERIALAQVPGGRVTENHLDTDNGRTVWNVHLSTPNGEVEVKVDAQTGAARIDDDSRGAPNTSPSKDDDSDDSDDRDDDSGDDHGRGGSDDGPGHDANDDHGRGGHGSDDGPNHS